MSKAFLEKHLPRLRTGKALVAPSGKGDEVILLARSGFEVTAYDREKKQVEHVQKRAEVEQVKITGEPKDLDMVILPLLSFDTIILTGPKPSSRYFSEISRSLAQGGTVLIEGLSVDEVVRGNDPDLHPNQCYKANELIRLLKGLRILYYSEEKVDGKYMVRCIAKKPTNRDAVKYGFAESRNKSDTKSAAQIAADKLFKK